jgi:predicted lipoprotein with Yx(FWY)xxD motif
MTHRAQTPTTSLRRPNPEVQTLRARRTLLTVCVAVASAGVAFALSAATPASASTATVNAANTASFGTILANAQGFSLYTLPTDHNGMSTCNAGCLQIWPALTVPSGTTPTSGPGVPGAVSTTMQSNGTDQVTYNGSPLYTYVGDTAPGQVNGSGLQGFVVAKVTLASGPPTTSPTTTSPITTAPTSSPTSTTAPTSSPTSTTAPTQAAAPSAASSSSPTTAAVAAAASTSSTSVPGSTSSLAFTGVGTALFWMAITGAALIAISLLAFAFGGAGRRRNQGGVRTG